MLRPRTLCPTRESCFASATSRLNDFVSFFCLISLVDGLSSCLITCCTWCCGVWQWQPTREGYLRFLVESKVVYDTLEQIVAEASHPECECPACLELPCVAAGQPTDACKQSPSRGVRLARCKSPSRGLGASKLCLGSHSQMQGFRTRGWNGQQLWSGTSPGLGSSTAWMHPSRWRMARGGRTPGDVQLLAAVVG
jgi:hypothetical protein